MGLDKIMHSASRKAHKDRRKAKKNKKIDKTQVKDGNVNKKKNIFLFWVSNQYKFLKYSILAKILT